MRAVAVRGGVAPLPVLLGWRVAQYALVAPLVLAVVVFAWLFAWLGRLAAVATKLGVVGFLLLLLPVVGWVILAVVYVGNGSSRVVARDVRARHRQDLAARLGGWLRWSVFPWPLPARWVRAV